MTSYLTGGSGGPVQTIQQASTWLGLCFDFVCFQNRCVCVCNAVVVYRRWCSSARTVDVWKCVFKCVLGLTQSSEQPNKKLVADVRQQQQQPTSICLMTQLLQSKRNVAFQQQLKPIKQRKEEHCHL